MHQGCLPHNKLHQVATKGGYLMTWNMHSRARITDINFLSDLVANQKMPIPCTLLMDAM